MYLFYLHNLSGYSAFSIIKFYLFLLKAKHERRESLVVTVQYWTWETSVKTSVMLQASWLTLGKSLWIGGSFAIDTMIL